MADCNICFGFIRHKDCVFKELLQCTEYIATRCYFCKKCWQCKVTREYQLELERKGFKTFNSEKKWWRIDWQKEKYNKPLPVLTCISK